MRWLRKGCKWSIFFSIFLDFIVLLVLHDVVWVIVTLPVVLDLLEYLMVGCVCRNPVLGKELKAYEREGLQIKLLALRQFSQEGSDLTQLNDEFVCFHVFVGILEDILAPAEEFFEVRFYWRGL